MEEFLIDLTRWEWWTIIAFTSLILEIFIPGAVFIWPALAAMMVALLAAFFPLTWEQNCILFTLLAITIGAFSRSAYTKLRYRSDNINLNENRERMQGTTCEVMEVITPTSGRVRLHDSSWSARIIEGPNLPVGSLVEIIDLKGNNYIVKATSIPNATPDTESSESESRSD